MSSVRVAVDIGGTFTDIVVLDSVDGKTHGQVAPGGREAVGTASGTATR